jgi:O-antigen/teichoic acid export membrane protein
MFFPGFALMAWTHSPAVVEDAAWPLAILAFAMLLNLCMQIPFALQLAAGNTSLPLWTNGLAVVILAPVIVELVRRYGIAGGALAWAVFNVLYYLIVPAIMHRRILPGHWRAWLGRDTLPFLALATACYGAAAWLGHRVVPQASPAALIAAATVLYGVVVVMTWGRSAIKFRVLASSPSTQ